MRFTASLPTKYVSLNNGLCMNRPTIIDLNPVELEYYPFMIRLGKCNESFNVADDLSTKLCVPIEIKDVNVEVFDTITRIDEVKTFVKSISCDCKCKFGNIICSSNQK